MKKFIDYLDMQPKWLMFFWGLFFVAVLGVIDYLTGDFSLTLFYLLPVFIGAWFVNKWAGLAICFLSGAVIILVRKLPPITSFDSSAMSVWNTSMEICFLVIMNYMFAILKKELNIEKALARTDHMTGALNRRSFMELAEYEINQSRRHKRPITIAYIDLDNFKAVNDSLGHHAGDLLLRTVVRILLENHRSTDVVARIGGDEFSVLYPETMAEAASEVLAKVREKLLDAMQANEWPVTFSIGAVTYTSPPASAEAMLREADAKMYEVKQTGKNMVAHVTVE